MDLIITTKEDLAEIIEITIRNVLAEDKKVVPAVPKPPKEFMSIAEAAEYLNLAGLGWILGFIEKGLSTRTNFL